MYGLVSSEPFLLLADLLTLGEVLLYLFVYKMGPVMAQPIVEEYIEIQ